MYHHVMRVAHQVIAEAFSNSVIVPGHDNERGRALVDAATGGRARPGELVPSVSKHPAPGRATHSRSGETGM